MAVTITETALKKIKEGMTASNLDPQSAFLRMGVKGGGCSGFSYALGFDTEQAPKDKLFEFTFPGAADDKPKLKVLVDLASYLLLNGVTLDYSTEGLGGFHFINPNAESSCGCGSSFST
ncbi:MAG: iron-sulfur cluster assembly accessory protein [Candidatus Sungiibacteriota bacterium]